MCHPEQLGEVLVAQSWQVDLLELTSSRRGDLGVGGSRFYASVDHGVLRAPAEADGPLQTPVFSESFQVTKSSG